MREAERSGAWRRKQSSAVWFVLSWRRRKDAENGAGRAVRPASPAPACFTYQVGSDVLQLAN